MNLKSHMPKKSADQCAYTANPQTILEIHPQDSNYRAGYNKQWHASSLKDEKKTKIKKYLKLFLIFLAC